MTPPSLRRSLRVFAQLFVCLPWLAASAADRELGVGGDLPAYEVAQPQAPPVTEANLLENESFWPFRVALTQEWKPPGSEAAPVKPGFPGILLRVEPDRRLRIDFGRQGAWSVPVAATDMIEQAERVRRGEQKKLGPNLVLVVGPHLSASTGSRPAPFDFAQAATFGAFLFVFADPAARDFPELAGALAALPASAGVGHVLFPQGSHAPDDVLRILQAGDWRPAFVFTAHSEPLTRSLLEDPTRLPALELETREGRSLFSGRWSKQDAALAQRLRAALEAAGATERVARETR
jgi:hypothetical protein